MSWATTTGRVLVVLTEFVVLLAFGSRFYFDKKVNDLNDEIDQKEVQIEAFYDTEVTIRKILAKQNPIGRYLVSNLSFGQRYDELGKLMPQGVKLDKLMIDNSGMGISGEAESELGFARLLQNLKKVQDLSHLSMKDTNYDQTTGTVKFNIQATFK